MDVDDETSQMKSDMQCVPLVLVCLPNLFVIFFSSFPDAIII